MARSAKRERQLARERYERRQARRQAAAARRRRLQQIVAIAVAVVLVVGGVIALAASLDGDGTTVATKDTSSPTATASESASPTPSSSAEGCDYRKTEQPAAKEVGMPAYDEKTATTPATATVVTDRGEIVIELATDQAPCTTTSFRHLAEMKYFDGTSCHRLTTANIFVLQCGDPSGTGSGGPGYEFGEENLPADAENNYPAGTVAMANAGPGTNGSQFFLVYKDTTLPPNYTIFGTVTKGLDVVQAVADKGVEGGGGDGKPAQSVTIERVRIGKA